MCGWAGQNVDPAYCPGRGYVDVAGADIYARHHGNLAPMFAQVKVIAGDTVPICVDWRAIGYSPSLAA